MNPTPSSSTAAHGTLCAIEKVSQEPLSSDEFREGVAGDTEKNTKSHTTRPFFFSLLSDADASRDKLVERVLLLHRVLVEIRCLNDLQVCVGI